MSELERLRAENERLRKLEAEAASHVEAVICARTNFTGEEPYIGWKGLGLALREALDERDRLREENERMKRVIGREGATMPRRIQRKRTKGWRMPEGAVCVDRSTRWGNPFEIGCGVVIRRSDGDTASLGKVETREQAVAWYRAFISHYPHVEQRARDQLRGRDLACWCPLDQPCHADVLLEIANG